MTYNELQSMFSGEVKNLFANYLSYCAMAKTCAELIREKTRETEKIANADCYGIFDYDLEDMETFQDTCQMIAKRYAYPREGKVGEK